MLPESKTCNDCKINFPISRFDVHTVNGKQRPSAYCKDCRRIRNRKTGKTYYAKHKEKIKQRESSYRAKPEYKEKHRAYKKNQNEKLTSGIVVSGLKVKLNLSTAEIRSVDGLIEVERSRILLNRKIGQLEVPPEGFRKCSHCETVKEIIEFRVRTERRKGKPEYTYTSGQCKKCESKIKNSYGKK